VVTLPSSAGDINCIWVVECVHHTTQACVLAWLDDARLWTALINYFWTLTVGSGRSQSTANQHKNSSVPGIDNVPFVLFVPLLLYRLMQRSVASWKIARTLSTFEISAALNHLTGGLDVFTTINN